MHTPAKQSCIFAGGANERNSAKRFLEIFAGLLIFDVIMVIIAVFLYEI